MKDSHTKNQFNIFKDFQKKCGKLMGRTELQTDGITDGRTGVKQYAPQLIVAGA